MENFELFIVTLGAYHHVCQKRDGKNIQLLKTTALKKAEKAIEAIHEGDAYINEENKIVMNY